MQHRNHAPVISFVIRLWAERCEVPAAPEWRFRIQHVQSGEATYVRTLAEDLARAAGSCAHLTALRRTSVAPFDRRAMVTLDEVLAAGGQLPLLAADAALPHLPAVELSAEAARRLQQGQTVAPQTDAAAGLARAYGPAGMFLGVVELQSGPWVKPVRLFNNLGADPT